MKTTVILASPHKQGNTAFFINEIIKVLGKTEVKWYNLYDMSYSGCRACYYCKKHEDCIIDDDMTEVYKDIKESDLIIMGTPIYFAAETGEMKKFMDRLYAFVDGNRNPKVTGKDFILITASGAPGQVYKPVAERISGIFKNFFGFNEIGTFCFGGLMRTLTAPEHTDEIAQLHKVINEFKERKDRE